MTTSDSQRQQLRVEVPMYVSQPPPQMRVKVAVEDGALVLTVRRQDGQPITDQGAGLRVDVSGDEYYDFNGWTA